MAKYVQRQYIGDDTTLIKALSSLFVEVPYSSLQKAIRKKDVTKNGKRMNGDGIVCTFDSIGLYFTFKPDVRYEDQSIVVYYKPKGISSVGENSFSTLVNVWLDNTFVPLHRLDTNTDGLIMFAKTPIVEEKFISFMKQGYITKGYLASVFGNASDIVGVHKAFLFKDSVAKKSYIHSSQVTGSEQITTQIKLISYCDNVSKIEVIISGGKMHQIRAHLAYLGHYVLGDSKYGRGDQSKKMGFLKQQLTAYKLSFNIPEGEFSYLNSIVII